MPLSTKLHKSAVVLFTLFISLFVLTSQANALGEGRYVSTDKKKGYFPLISGEANATLYVDANDKLGAKIAVESFQKDVLAVTDKTIELVHSAEKLNKYSVIVGTLGHSELIAELVAQNKIDVSKVEGVWDAYSLQVIDKPLEGVEKALVIVGANRRATAYGVYDVSEQIGVSPWYYWADGAINKSKALYIDGQLSKTDAPKVKYRGIFLNDEAPALSSWVAENHGNYTHEFYVKVFELLLRLKANFMWPAMWNNAFADDDPQNMILAHEYGIVMSTSHHEPMMRADKEWNRHGEGAWEYSTNPKNLYKFWEDGAKRNRDYESIYTMGMRGQEDKPMSEGENIELLETIVNDQREILAKVFDDRELAEVPQVWCLYKEVQSYYEKGMRVPDDVILLWTDDNWGNIRRLPTPEERKRSGGAGVYYHFDYVGGPRSYRWLNTYPLAKIWEQMNLAYHYEANQIWITNVGDLKPMEFPIEFFLRMAWNPDQWPKERIQEFGQLWAEREFGKEFAVEIEAILSDYTRHNGRRKPELLEPDTYSLLYFNEADRIEAELTDLIERAEKIYAKIPADKKDAFYQLVLWPAKASATVGLMNIAIGKNRLYATQGRSYANKYADKAKALFAQDAALEQEYHALNGGKWNHFANQPHIGYTNWNNPEADQMPATYDYSPGDYAEMGIAVEGIEAGWPGDVSGKWPHTGSYQLSYDKNGQSTRQFIMYNRGTKAYTYKAKTSDDWIKLSVKTADVKVEQKVDVSVDWSKLPEGESKGSITIRGTGWPKATIAVHAFKPPKKLDKKAKGFLETDGYIAIEAANFKKSKSASGIQWEAIPQHGRTHSAISTFPIGDKSFENYKSAPYVEYDLTFFSTGEFQVQTVLAPSWPFFPGRGLRYAISLGDEEPQIVDFLKGFDGTDENWEESVKDGVRYGFTKHKIKEAGKTKLRIYMVDPGVTIQKLLIDTGGLYPSYLGPEQSPYRK